MKSVADTVVELSQIPPEDELAGMTHSGLIALRNKLATQQLQNKVAPFEHRAFARESVTENPLMALSLALATPAYQISKALPKSVTGNKSRSEPSLEQLKQGFIGIGEGLRGSFGRMLSGVP